MTHRKIMIPCIQSENKAFLTFSKKTQAPKNQGLFRPKLNKLDQLRYEFLTLFTGFRQAKAGLGETSSLLLLLLVLMITLLSFALLSFMLCSSFQWSHFKCQTFVQEINQLHQVRFGTWKFLGMVSLKVLDFFVELLINYVWFRAGTQNFWGYGLT